ncbi:protein-glutamate O-methyltransferase CheR [bacterium]|nr:protein-glutamate O-methyltransferase CheR [bacterium]
MSTLSQEDYQFVSGFLYEEAGIALGGDKAYLVENRLGELCRSVGLHSISALVQELKSIPTTQNRQKMLEAMTTNETSFFRDLNSFDSMRTSLLPELEDLRKSRRALRVWSAACSTGQETYSLAMLIDSHLGQHRKSWQIDILGTDIAEKVLHRAKTGEYSQLEVNRGLPAQLLMRHFKRKGRGWHVSDNIRSMVRFEQVNLMSVPASLGQFDLILCRNVLIYFDVQTRQKVLANLHRQIKPDGYLIVGASEVLHGLTDLFERTQRDGAICYRPAYRPG